MSTHASMIEAAARDIARKVIAVPGWCADVVGVVVAVRDAILAIGGPDRWRLADRTEAILREVAADPAALIDRYPDLLPADLLAVMTAKAVEVLKDAGATVETFKDDDGTTFLRLENVEALGISADEMECMAAGAPDPTGRLHRLH